MGYRLVKHLESSGYNRRLFYLDRGAIDLPPITNLTEIMPGSEARSLTTGEKWILNSYYKWVYVPVGCECCGATGGTGSDDVVPGEEPTIQGVSLNPANVTLAPGASVAFNATLDADPALSRGLKWTIKGQRSKDTVLTQDGILTVGEDEKSKSITVRATSDIDETIYAQAVVTIDAEMEHPDETVVTGITIIPGSAEVVLGNATMFNAIVSGINVHDIGFTLEMAGAKSHNTTLSQEGILRVATDETATTILVKAISKADTTKTAEAIVKVVPQEYTNTTSTVTGVEIVPDIMTIGASYSAQFVARVLGVNNPSPQVVWKLSEGTDPATRVTANGSVFIGKDEKITFFTLTAYSVQDPTYKAESDIHVVPAETPGVAAPTVTAVIVTPDMVELTEGKQVTFSHVVIGQNNPSQAVTWAIKGEHVPTTYLTEQGTLTIGIGETDDTIELRCTSVQDPTKYATVYVTVVKQTFSPATGIADIPEVPANTQYVRERTINGHAVWTALPKEEEELPPEPVIRGIYVTPETITAAPGAEIQFTSQMDGSAELSDAVEWTVQGQTSENTIIQHNGLLSIGFDETSLMISVKATSVVDTTKFGRATIAVDPSVPIEAVVSSVTMIPKEAEVIRGKSMIFQTVLSGMNIQDSGVTYTVEGASQEDTHIDENGVLFVDKDENSPVLIVTATSKQDPTKSATAVVSVMVEELVVNPPSITTLSVQPAAALVGQGLSTRFAVVITGLNNPPQDVLWEVSGNNFNGTSIGRDGTLYVDSRERVNTVLTIRATAVYDPEKFAEASVTVLDSSDPAVAEVTVTAVILSPSVMETSVSNRHTFQATVVGNNNPSQAVTWQLSGNLSSKTVISDKGVLTIDSSETATVLRLRVTSVADQTKYATGYVTITKSQALPDTGIPDVPEAPLDTEYVRKRDKTGKAIWVGHTGGGADGPMYIGMTFATKAEMDEYGVPDTARPGDYTYVEHDEEHAQSTVMYTIVLNRQGKMEYQYTMSMAHPPILGDKLDILYILDNGDHSTLLRNIEVIEDFDTTEERWELFQSPSAWKLVTELHPAFREAVMAHPDWYKLIVGMSRETGLVKAYLTCMTDEHEFEQLWEIDIENPEIIAPTILDWTCTVMKANTFAASSNTEFRQYEFNRKTMTMKVTHEQHFPEAAKPAVSPWATVVGEYSMMADGTIIGPLAGVTDSNGYLWVSPRERFMIGSAGDGTQMFIYNIDLKNYYIFDVPAGQKKNYHFATDIHERYFLFWISQTSYVWGDRMTGTFLQGTWHPGAGYSGLSEPSDTTRPMLSIDGQHYYHTSTNQTTKELYVYSTQAGTEVASSEYTGESSVALQTDNGIIFQANYQGEVHGYELSNGTLIRKYVNQPWVGRYIAVVTNVPNRILMVKAAPTASGETVGTGPLWYVVDTSNGQVVAQSENIGAEYYVEPTNPNGKSFAYPLEYEGEERYLVNNHTEEDGYVVQYTNGRWYETWLPFSGLENDKQNYNQPMLLDGGRVIAVVTKDGTVRGYDFASGDEVDLDELAAQAAAHAVQLNDDHFMWCGLEGSQLVRMVDGVATIVFEIPEQQVCVYGFGFGDSDSDDNPDN